MKTQMIKTAQGPSDVHWFDQKLDHYKVNPQTFNTTFKQRYYINDNFYDSSKQLGVVIFYIAGEGTQTSAPGGDANSMDVLGQIAQENNGLIYALEHRFYGESQPFSSDPENLYSTEHLAYLSKSQAHGDLLYFAQEINKQLAQQLNMTVVPGVTVAPFICAGGSYAGSVSAQLQQRHGSIFTAAISSSGVVNASYDNSNFDTQTLAAAGPVCGGAMRMAIEEINQNLSYWKSQFNASYANDGDFNYFIADSGLMAIQYGNYTGICEDALIPAYTENQDLAAAYVQFILENGYTWSDYDINVLSNISREENNARSWEWQCCTEMAFWQPAPQINSIRNQIVTLQYFEGICQTAFNFTTSEAVTDRHNDFYGSTKVNGEHTIFANYWMDIWHLDGVTTPSDTRQHVQYSKNIYGSHCRDLHTYRSDDEQEIKDVRQAEVDFINQEISNWWNRS